MKHNIIRANSLEEHNYGSTHVINVLNDEECPFFSIAKVTKVGDDIKTGYDTESNVAYYVFEGEGDCVIDGKTYHLKKGDCVYYPSGVAYKHLKGLTLLAIASPRFDRKKRVYTE